MKSCILLQSLIADTRLLKIGTQKEATLRIIGPSKLAILRTLTLLHRFVHPSIGGSKIRSVFKKCEMKLIVALLSLLRKLIHPMWCSKCRWFDSSEVCILCISLPSKILSKPLAALGICKHPKNPVTSRPNVPSSNPYRTCQSSWSISGLSFFSRSEM